MRYQINARQRIIYISNLLVSLVVFSNQSYRLVYWYLVGLTGHRILVFSRKNRNNSNDNNSNDNNNISNTSNNTTNNNTNEFVFKRYLGRFPRVTFFGLKSRFEDQLLIP